MKSVDSLRKMVADKYSHDVEHHHLNISMNIEDDGDGLWAVAMSVWDSTTESESIRDSVDARNSNLSEAYADAMRQFVQKLTGS